GQDDNSSPRFVSGRRFKRARSSPDESDCLGAGIFPEAAMRLIHLADIHLGFRQYQKQTISGINQREADVAATLKRVIDKIIELKPDIVLIAGDVFHTVRPTNPAILHAFTQFSRLMRMLPDANV